ncbi:efflux RND transporter permease subunit [bacterium]|nr:efflux RND transporter permease subunit [bacterium]
MGEFFVRRPIVAMVIAIIMTIVGIIAMKGLPIAQYPDLTPPMVQVTTTYTGANAINVEQSLATPIEQKVNGVDNMIYMQSINSNSGTMKIKVSFDLATDPDMNTVLTQNRVSTVSQIPTEVKEYGVTTKKTFSFPLMILTLTSPTDAYSRNFVGNYALINIIDELARIPGVGQADVMGVGNYSMRIWVKPDKLTQLSVTVSEILGAIKSQNVLVPGGKFGGEPAPPGTDFTYTVTMKDRLKTAEEFGNIIVRTETDGAQIRLKDLARIELGSELYEAYTRLNEKECAAIFVYQAPGSNAMDVQAQVLATMDRLSTKFPGDIQYDTSLDTTRAISAGMKEIVISFIVALLLVILVVFLFLQDWRATLIPTIAIPVSLLSAFSLFPALGFSINTLSLLGMVLAIGIVVDDAIVVVEAVTVYIEKGLTPKMATIQAMKDVTAPVIATTLVLVAVFLPVTYIAGITGKLYQEFAMTIAVSVVFSSINALTLSPALCALLLRKSEPTKGVLGGFFNLFNRVLDRSTEGYISFTSIIARKIKRGAFFILILSGLIVVIGNFLPGGFMPEEDQGYLIVNVQLPNASSLQRSLAVTKKVEKIIMKYDQVEYATAIPGFSILTGGMATNSASIFITLKPWDKREGTALELNERLNQDFRKEIRAAKVVSFGPPAIQGLGNGSGFSIMIQDKGGNSVDYLAQHTNEFIMAANKRPEIARAFTTFNAKVPQRHIEINREKALKAKVSLSDLNNTIGAFLGGVYVNDFNRFGRLYKTYLQADHQYRQSEKNISDFFVKNGDGDMVPLATLATISNIVGPEYTTRFNLYRAIEVMGSPAKGYSSSQANEALKEVAAEILPTDMGYAWNALSYQEESASGTAALIFAFSLFFVFLILAAQYESWSLPLSILLGTPFAIFGAFFALYISRLIFGGSYENNIFAQISLVMLIAMAAKNAILIVEFANMEFEKGKSLYDSAISAAKLRFRPILMTAFSFILGILPLLIASGAGAESRKVMGMTLFGGMFVATLVGVFMYPMLFIMVGKLGKYEQKRDAAKAEEQQAEVAQ